MVSFEEGRSPETTANRMLNQKQLTKTVVNNLVRAVIFLGAALATRATVVYTQPHNGSADLSLLTRCGLFRLPHS